MKKILGSQCGRQKTAAICININAVPDCNEILQGQISNKSVFVPGAKMTIETFSKINCEGPLTFWLVFGMCSCY